MVNNPTKPKPTKRRPMSHVECSFFVKHVPSSLARRFVRQCRRSGVFRGVQIMRLISEWVGKEEALELKERAS